MQKLMLTYEAGKGYTLTIDGFAFEKLVTAFSIEGVRTGAPHVRLELIGGKALEPRQAENN